MPNIILKLKISLIFIVMSLFLITVTKKQEKEFNWNWFQNDTLLEPHHIEVSGYDKRYVRFVDARSFKFNRTCVAHNFTVNYKITVGNDLEVVSQTYKFASNEYRLFPIRLGLKVCKGLAANILGISSITKCGNFTGCSFLKDRTYHTCNNVAKEEKMPPLLPTGSFMLEWTFLFKNIELYTLKAYARVYRPFNGK